MNFNAIKHRLLVFFCMLTVTLLCGVPYQDVGAKSSSSGQKQPDKQKRSSIHMVDGYAYLSEDMTLSESRAAAFASAKRQAVEMAKTYITSHTVVEDFELKKDQITGTAEGAVTILEQKDHGIEDNRRYHVWIKAEVEYGINERVVSKTNPVSPQAGSSESNQLKAPLTVKVWTSQKKYQRGDKITIFVQGNRDFYARIVDITSDGQIIQLLPNDFRRNQYFKANTIYRIPDKEDRFELKVTPPYGTDQIVVYASEAPLGNVKGMQQLSRGLTQFNGSQTDFEMQTRGITVSASGKSAELGTEFFEATWSLKTTQ